jgi:hypothetical protein
MLTGFFGIFRLDERFQVRKVDLPEAAVLIEPGIDGAQGFGIELVDAMPAFAMLTNQVGTAKQAEMFRDGWTRDRKGLGDFPGGLPASTQKVENGAASRVGKSLERCLRVCR